MKGLAGGTFPIKEKIGGDSREKGVAVSLFPTLSCLKVSQGVERRADRQGAARGEDHPQSPPEAPLWAEDRPKVERPAG